MNTVYKLTNKAKKLIDKYIHDDSIHRIILNVDTIYNSKFNKSTLINYYENMIIILENRLERKDRKLEMDNFYGNEMKIYKDILSNLNTYVDTMIKEKYIIIE